MFEDWYQLFWHIAYLAIFAAGMGMARGEDYRKVKSMEEDDKALDARRRQGGYTFNVILKEMRAEIEAQEETTIEDLVSTESAEVREIRAEQLRSLRRWKEKIDRMLNMREPGKS